MTNQQEDIDVAASEQPGIEPQETPQEEPKMVPLAALEAERRKRQEAEARRLESDARANAYQELARSKNEPQEPEEDPEALLTKGAFKEEKEQTKREIVEQIYQELNPAALDKINKYLKPILDKKPWLAASLDSAPNRYARANEIVDDYKHLVEDPLRAKQSGSSDAKKIVDNANKPRSPVEIGKSARPTGAEYLKSIQGKKEFREYRDKVLRGEA